MASLSTANINESANGARGLRSDHRAWVPSVRIVLIYAVLAGSWILFSDTLLARVTQDPDLLTRLQTAKGWAFVAISSMLLFLLIRASHLAIQQESDRHASSDELLMNIFEESPLGTFVVDERGNYRRVNQAFADFLGYARDQLLHMNFEDVTYPPDIGLTNHFYLEGGLDERIAVEKRYVRADGAVRWGHLTATRLSDHAPGFGLGIVNDITERKQREEELRNTLDALRASQGQRRELVDALLRAEEGERQRIAADIHDDTLQVMTAVLMTLDLAQMETEPDRQWDMVTAAAERLRQAAQGLRHLVFELRPSVLRTQGLAAALSVYLEQAAADSGGFRWNIDCRLAEEPPEQVRLLAYRVAREALVNAVKHAKPSQVSVAVDVVDDALRFLIEDDGVGFDPASLRVNERKSMGLALMRERVELFGGTFGVESARGRGTSVEFTLPLSSHTAGGQLTLDDSPAAVWS